MGAIDLLFEDNLDSERLHQIALRALIKGSRILPLLVGDSLPSGAEVNVCRWEPKGGLYDLAVPLGERQHLFIELKVDSPFGGHQLQRQLQRLSESGDRVLYILLGCTAISMPADNILPMAKEKMKVPPGRCLVRTAPDLIAALESPQLLPAPAAADVGDLSTAYLRQLRRMEGQVSQFFGRPIDHWKAGDYFGFFAHCRRQKIGGMGQTGINYVANPNGGFIGCWWAWQEAGPVAKVYLQFEWRQLCIKIEVSDKQRQGDLRNRASAALQGMPPRAAFKIERPDRMGSGQCMTVGVIKNLPLGQRERMADFAEAIQEAEQIVQELAELLKAPPSPLSGPSTGLGTLPGQP